MNPLTLTCQSSGSYTVLCNHFIDCYMPHASGEFVKIYIYLLRCAGSQVPVSVSSIADFFDQTEADVLRAMRYWDKKGVLKLGFDSSGSVLSSIVFCDMPASGNDAYAADAAKTAAQETSGSSGSGSAQPEKSPRSAYTPSQLRQLSEQDEFSMLLYAVGAYLGGTLNASEASVIAYMYDTLHFPSDLVEYLIEYCVSKGHKNIRYIEKVALAWAELGIRTVKEAKKTASGYSAAVHSVLNAFGISNRDAGQRERDYIKKWTDVYCFDTDLIVEACNRTLKATHQPSFEYADSILSKWQQDNVRTAEDIRRSDAAFEKSRSTRQNRAAAPKSNNRFNNFQQRNTDIDSLEGALISNKA